jgi:hypothetical protein
VRLLTKSSLERERSLKRMQSLANIDLKALFYVVPVILFIHEMEEWNIYDFHKNAYASHTVAETKLSGRLWLLFLSLFGFVWTIFACALPGIRLETIVFMLLIDFTLMNGIQHVSLSLQTHRYNPGLIFGGIIGLLGDALVLWRVIADGILPAWLVAVLVAPILPPLLESFAAKSKSRLPRSITVLLRFASFLEHKMTE